MPRGWRNNPEWVRLYQEREEKRIARGFYLSALKQEADMVRKTLNYRIDKVRWDRPSGWNAP